MSENDNEAFRKKRQNYLESAMIMNRLLDERYFQGVVEALKKKEDGKEDFQKICTKIEIPDAMVDTLWKTLLDVDKKMAQAPGWIIGPR